MRRALALVASTCLLVLGFVAVSSAAPSKVKLRPIARVAYKGGSHLTFGNGFAYGGELNGVGDGTRRATRTRAESASSTSPTSPARSDFSIVPETTWTLPTCARACSRSDITKRRAPSRGRDCSRSMSASPRDLSYWVTSPIPHH